MKKGDKWRALLWWILGIAILSALIFMIITFLSEPFGNEKIYTTSYQAGAAITLPVPFVVRHVPIPEPLKGLYMTGYVAGNTKFRETLVNLIDETELNAVIIDIKDYTGHLSFVPEDPKLKSWGGAENRISDIKEFIGRLHDKGIYVIGRISAFQDSYMVGQHPEYAVKSKNGKVWKDFKGVSWLDAGAKPIWEYLALIGKEAYSVGFDELNFDYIRFPSDGDMEDIAYPYSQGKVKAVVLKEFFAFIDQNFRSVSSPSPSSIKVPISADLFGMTTSNRDDLGIGQVLENALEHFDYVAPMVYPSHYPPNFNGWKNPAAKPYETVYYAMTKGVEKAVAASTTPSKLRPWLQDFSINHTPYTPEMIRAEIKATYDSGLTSWMVWNASNVYTTSAYLISTSTQMSQ